MLCGTNNETMQSWLDPKLIPQNFPRVVRRWGGSVRSKFMSQTLVTVETSQEYWDDAQMTLTDSF